MSFLLTNAVPIPPPTPVETFASFIRGLTEAVAAMSGGDWLSTVLIALIVGCIRDIEQCFAQFAARIAAGTDTPRHSSAPRRSSTAGRPRPPSKLPYNFGWLLPLVSDANGDRSQCHHLLRAPEMAAPLAAAPAATSRPLRPLCWMLRLSPPAILASPRAAPPQPSPPPPPPAARAASPPAPPPCACGPPLPAGAGPWRLHVHIVPLSEP